MDYRTKTGVTGAMLDMMPQIIDKLFPLTLTVSRVNGNIETGQSIIPQASFVVKDKDGVDVTALSVVSVDGATVNMTAKKWTSNASITETTSFTTKVNYNGQEKTASTQWLVADYIYYGSVDSLPATFDETSIKELASDKKITKEISKARNKDIAVASGKYFVFAVPVSNLEGKSLKVTDAQGNNYDSNVTEVTGKQFTRENGDKVDYYILYLNGPSGASWTYKIVDR